MKSVKKCFEQEVATTVESIRRVRGEGDLCFALLTDSLLYDTGVDTRENIRAVDDAVGFDFIAHLGNFISGVNPEKISRRLFREELEAYRNCTAGGKLLVGQGDQDGYRDENFAGQMVWSIVRDDMWHEDTAFLDSYENLHREGDAPYYFIDFPEKKVRIVVLCSYQHEFDGEHLLFEKRTTYGLKQVAWMQDKALHLDEGWQVLFLSHALPKSRFETGKDPFIYKGFSTEKVLSIVQKAARERKITVIGFLGGRYGYDAEIKVAEIPHIAIGKQFPQVCPTPSVEGAVTPETRELGTVYQDLWDACVLRPEERKLYLFRFGAGEDRVIEY